MPVFTIEAARAVLRERFAAWVRDLDLQFEHIEPGRVRLRLPFSERLARTGGMISGQAIMAAADTAMVFAIASRAGQFVDAATVNQSTSFFRAGAGDLIIDVRVIKQGRTLAFGEAMISTVGRPDDPVAQATMTYALAAPR
jgi:uncharacterized protein (TIGR00369 family)